MAASRAQSSFASRNETQEPLPLLRFTFGSEAVYAATPARERRNRSIKEAIIRWLEQQL